MAGWLELLLRGHAVPTALAADIDVVALECLFVAVEPVEHLGDDPAAYRVVAILDVFFDWCPVGYLHPDDVWVKAPDQRFHIKRPNCWVAG